WLERPVLRSGLTKQREGGCPVVQDAVEPPTGVGPHISKDVRHGRDRNVIHHKASADLEYASHIVPIDSWVRKPMCAINESHIQNSLPAKGGQNQIGKTRDQRQATGVDTNLLEVVEHPLVFFSIWTYGCVVRPLRGKDHRRCAASGLKGPVPIANRLLEGPKCARQ